MATLTHKRCAKCKQVKPAEKFYICLSRPSGRRPYCIACDKAKTKSSYARRRQKKAQERATARYPEPVPFFRIHDVWPIYRPNQG